MPPKLNFEGPRRSMPPRFMMLSILPKNPLPVGLPFWMALRPQKVKNMVVSMPMAAAVVAMMNAANTLSMSPLKTMMEHFVCLRSFFPPCVYQILLISAMSCNRLSRFSRSCPISENGWLPAGAGCLRGQGFHRAQGARCLPILRVLQRPSPCCKPTGSASPSSSGKSRSQLAAGRNGHRLAVYLDGRAGTQQTCMAGVELSIARLFPISGAATLSFSSGQDQIAEVARVADLGQGLAFKIGGDNANIQRLGADALDGLDTG